MKFTGLKNYTARLACCVLICALWAIVFAPARLCAQTISSAADKTDADKSDNKNFASGEEFRAEKVSVAGGAEIVTIFAKLGNLTDAAPNEAGEIPLVSILRDTLGDDRPENDRLRYVWLMTHADSSMTQKMAAAVPFLYVRTTNVNSVGSAPPPVLLDLQSSKKAVWNNVFWRVFKNLILEDFGVGAKSAAVQYRTNRINYRKVAVARALAVMSLYESVEDEKILTDAETRDIQARMQVAGDVRGAFMQSENLERVYQKNVGRTRDWRGHNWELLRQTAEAQGLYFEPLEMLDGSHTHALVWAAETDLEINKNREFDGRFLNIKNPWNDADLLKRRAYSEVRWFDADDRSASSDTPGARPKTMIPLALYGLDYPKIPVLLVDFRDRNNAKRREMSKRVLDDLTNNVLSISKFGSLPFFVGRYVYDFVTARRGMDLNRESRFRTYSQLKLLLTLDASLDTDFKRDISSRLEAVSLNPLENDANAEIRLARRQYENLLAYAARPDGLPARIESDRRRELIELRHGAGKRLLFSIGRVFSFGLYRHSEPDTPELRREMDVRRQLEYHERRLREAARESAKPEIDGDIEAIRDSLNFVSQSGARADAKTAKSIARIFSITEDERTRELSLASLYCIDNRTAKSELLAIYENRSLAARWRNASADYLRLAVKERQRMSDADAAKFNEIEGK